MWYLWLLMIFWVNFCICGITGTWYLWSLNFEYLLLAEALLPCLLWRYITTLFESYSEGSQFSAPLPHNPYCFQTSNWNQMSQCCTFAESNWADKDYIWTLKKKKKDFCYRISKIFRNMCRNEFWQRKGEGERQIALISAFGWVYAVVQLPKTLDSLF